MPRMSSLVQMPSRSGWPHDRRGAFQFGSFTLAAVVSAGIARNAEGALVGADEAAAPPRPPAPPRGAPAAAAGAGTDERDRSATTRPVTRNDARTLCRITRLLSGFSHNMSQMTSTPRRVLLVTGGSRGIGAATVRLAAAARLRRVRQLPRGRRAAAHGGRCRHAGRGARGRRAGRRGRRGATWSGCSTPATNGSAGSRRWSTTPPSSKPRRGSTPWTRRASAGCSPPTSPAPSCARARRCGACPRATAAAGGAIVNVSSGASQLGIAGRVHRLRRHQRRARHDDDRAVARGGRRRDSRQRRPRRARLHRRCTPAAASRIAWSASSRRCRWAAAAQPEEIAQAILWLLSDEASYTTGAFLDVAGGK